MQLFVHTLCGANDSFRQGLPVPNVVLDQLVRTRVTGFSGVPYHFAALIDRSTFLQAALPHLRWIHGDRRQMPPERVVQIRSAQPAMVASRRISAPGRSSEDRAGSRGVRSAPSRSASAVADPGRRWAEVPVIHLRCGSAACKNVLRSIKAAKW